MVRSRLAWVTVAGLAVHATYAAVSIVHRSGDPGRYYLHRLDHSSFTYPTTEVGIWMTAVIVEALVVALLVARARRPARVGALLAVAVLAVGIALLPFCMHAPPYFTGHVLALLLLGGWLIVASTAIAIVGAAAARRHKPAPAAS